VFIERDAGRKIVALRLRVLHVAPAGGAAGEIDNNWNAALDRNRPGDGVIADGRLGRLDAGDRCAAGTRRHEADQPFLCRQPCEH
jgi:hypothetical protein